MVKDDLRPFRKVENDLRFDPSDDDVLHDGLDVCELEIWFNTKYVHELHQFVGQIIITII